MRRPLNSGALLAAAAAIALFVDPSRATLAVFTNSTTLGSNVVTAQRVFSAQRVSTAFHVFDASAGGSASDQSSPAAFDDGRQRATGAWGLSFSSTRYLEYDLESTVPSGLTVTAASFNFKFASQLVVDNSCFYFETRTASTGALLTTYGSAGSTIGCVSNTTQTSFSTSIVSSVSSSAVANDLRIRVYGDSTVLAAWNVELATVTITVNVGTFTLYRTKLTDRSTGTASTDVWDLAAAGDGYSYTSQSAWSTAFSSSRYIEFRLPAFVPSGSVITSAELRHSYRPAAGGTPNACYYFEVFDTTTLLATHGSTTSPVSCQTSTSSFATDIVPLSEIDSYDHSDDIRVRLFFEDAAAVATVFDQLRVAITYSTP